MMQNADPQEIIAGTCRKVSKFMLHENLLPPNGRLLLAVSGGIDSVAMTDILQRLAPELKLELHIAHLNHCLRGPYADRDEEFVRRLGQTRNIGVTVQKTDVANIAKAHKDNIEEAARQIRYTFFLVTAYKENCAHIATAHHMQDNAESILLNLLRGTGLTGLEGIKPKRDGLDTFGYPIVRPLLCLDRPEIEAYAEAAGLDYVFDHTNDYVDLKRNAVRHELLPLLRERFNPKIVKAVNRLGAIVRDENISAVTTADMWLNANACEIEYGISFAAEGFNALPAALRRRVVRQAVLKIKQHLLRVGLKHVEAVLKLAQSSEPLKRVEMPDNMLAVKRGERLEIIKPQIPLRQFIFEEQNPDYAFKLNPGEDLLVPSVNMRFKCTQFSQTLPKLAANTLQNAVFFDIKNLALPLTVRNPRAGDTFAPLGFNGHVKLTKFFINSKVPFAKRKSWPLITDANDEIVWVVGLRLGRAARISDAKADFIKVEACYIEK